MTNTAAAQTFGPCHFCTAPITTVDGNHWDGAVYVRVQVCDTCYDGGKLARKPRVARVKRPTEQVHSGEWNALVAYTAARRRASRASS